MSDHRQHGRFADSDDKKLDFVRPEVFATGSRGHRRMPAESRTRQTSAMLPWENATSEAGSNWWPTPDSE